MEERKVGREGCNLREVRYQRRGCASGGRLIRGRPDATTVLAGTGRAGATDGHLSPAVDSAGRNVPLRAPEVDVRMVQWMYVACGMGASCSRCACRRRTCWIGGRFGGAAGPGKKSINTRPKSADCFGMSAV